MMKNVGLRGSLKYYLTMDTYIPDQQSVSIEVNSICRTVNMREKDRIMCFIQNRYCRVYIGHFILGSFEGLNDCCWQFSIRRNLRREECWEAKPGENPEMHSVCESFFLHLLCYFRPLLIAISTLPNIWYNYFVLILTELASRNQEPNSMK